MNDETPRTVVHLLRHGEVDNPSRIIYGRLPGFGLTADGLLMAKAAARALADRDIVVVRSSPLERAVQTAEAVAAALGLEVGVDDRLIEPTNHFEGLTFGVGDGAVRRPNHWKHLRNPFLPSWGEPYREVAARMLVAVAAARDAARAAAPEGGGPGGEAVCVSHQLPIWVTRRAVEGRKLWHRPDRRQCGLASLTSLTYVGDRIVAVAYSEPAGTAARRPHVAGA
ncbi:MAG: histidine phosphatase family protein [Streptosporangiales bacterium]|nr:histidine phosphatase family protein [Streptosporangiales bacterium]